ncbi:hypothetical protein MWT96_20265 [Prescottella equi]|uniref:hypothetical protein n=1 Tax=Rhodococcus hoagii TaxID=43767 RepID=UPI001A03017C|nr:hypothetical protein [Prescottella equi]MBM4496342.1 hypothetical protein [Prescottella equi]MBM4592339.1 hypothetical protein [Prescottella equi]MBM4594304.1 hypothetical protein [Prescottella equi]MBM4607737.1 hypothetical protein [Prescottella equi]MBM4643848.1 hypothetical protein [Prescottella equi]
MKLKFNPEALYEVRRSASVVSRVHQAAAQVATRAGNGYSWSSRQGMKRPQGRWRAIVYPDTWSARQDNAKNNTLVRVMGRGG